MAQPVSTLSQSSITYKVIQNFPDSVKTTATKVAEFIQTHRDCIFLAAVIISLSVATPLAMKAGLISIGLIAGLRVIEKILPQKLSDPIQSLTHMKKADKGMIIVAGTIGSIITMNPLLFEVAIDVNFADSLCNIASAIFTFLGEAFA